MKIFNDLNSFREYKQRFVKEHQREQWKVECRSQLNLYFDCCDDNENVSQLLLEIIEDLLLEMEGDTLRREEMTNFMQIFTFLVKCAQLQELTIRKPSQSVLRRLLEMFEWTAQHLLICRLFDMVLTRSIVVDMEPQILAWLVDLYRKRLSDRDEKCRATFFDNISHFYGQIGAVIYEDMLAAHHFYISVMLLLSYHAAIGVQLELLSTLRVKLLDAYQMQLVDYLQMKNIEKQSGKPKLGVELEMEEPLFALNLLKFTISDTRSKLDNVLQKT